ncbi:DUF3461 family protein [Neptunomonas sp.]|uniref:DUF3461 family protein n=1 Tax=Neptunomonas sp. TaxID=1971898 RepID=UPI0025E37EF6|nr:DUF3461 family protein [Neptunomonas sp.]
MSEYSTLKTMGLNDPHAISHYKLSQKNDQEVLKIYFKNSETSALPESSSFYFECNKVIAADAQAKEKSKHNGGSDPVLMAAIAELNTLSKKQSNSDRRTVLMEELDKMEQVMAAKIQELRNDLSRMA